jgi:hypothetical protein
MSRDHPGGIDIDIPFHNRCLNALEQKSLYDHATPASRRRLGRPPPVLSILEDYAHEKILRVAQQGDLLEALKGLNELHYVMKMLVRLGKHPELKETIKMLEAGWDRIAAASRQRLVDEFLSPATAPDDVELIEEALIHIIKSGSWPDWKREFNAAVEARSCAMVSNAGSGQA